MSSLTGLSIASTYERLLALPSGGGATSTLRALTDGDGVTTFALQISNAGIASTGTLAVTGASTLTGNVAFGGTIIVGSAGAGKDVTFYSNTSGDQFLWDSSDEKLVITGTNGQLALEIVDGDVSISSGDKLRFDGSVGGDTYMSDNGSDLLTFTVGALDILKLDQDATKVEVLGSDLEIDATKKLYFDGGDDTYISETAGNQLKFYVGNVGTDPNLMLFLDGANDDIHMQCDELVIMDTTGSSPRFAIASDVTDVGTGDLGNTGHIHEIRLSGNDWAYGTISLGLNHTSASYHPVEVNGSKVTFNGTAASKLGVGILTPPNFMTVAPIHYNTGTASQSGTTVTGSGTTFTAAMVGSQFIYADGTSSGLITAYASGTSISVTTSQTVSSQAYKIHYPGVNIKTDGKVGIGTTTPDCDLHVAGQAAFSGPSETFVTMSSGDTSPDVSTGNIFKSHSDGVTIDQFDGGICGQIITIISGGATVYDVTSSELKGGTTNITTAAGDVTMWVCESATVWHLLSWMDLSIDLSSGGF